jgi:hypothetical protein
LQPKSCLHILKIAHHKPTQPKNPGSKQTQKAC